MFGAFWYHKRVARLETYGRLHTTRIAQCDVEHTVEYEKELVGVLMHVPDVLAVDLGNSHVVVIDPLDDPRTPVLVERRECLGEVDRPRSASR